MDILDIYLGNIFYFNLEMSVEEKRQSISSIKIEDKAKNVKRDLELKGSHSFSYTNKTSKMRFEDSEELSTKLTKSFSWHFLLNLSFRSRVFESGVNSNLESTSIKATIDSRHKAADLKRSNNLSYIDNNFSGVMENISSDFLQSHQSSCLNTSSNNKSGNDFSRVSKIKRNDLSRSKFIIGNQDYNLAGAKKIIKKLLSDDDSRNFIKLVRSKSINIRSGTKICEEKGNGHAEGNQMIDRDLWINAMARARVQEAKEESIPSDIYSDSKMMTSSENTHNNQKNHYKQDPTAAAGHVQNNPSKKYKDSHSTLENDSYFKETYIKPSQPEAQIRSCSKKDIIKSKDRQVFHEDENSKKKAKENPKIIKESSESSGITIHSGSSNAMKEKENHIPSNEEKSPNTGNNNTDSNSQSSHQAVHEIKENFNCPAKNISFVVETQQASNFEIFGKTHETKLKDNSAVNNSKHSRISSNSGHYQLKKLSSIQLTHYHEFIEGKVEKIISNHKGSIFFQNMLNRLNSEVLVQVFREVSFAI